MKPRNHESYTTCKNCGHEYNFWDHGHTCPNCPNSPKSPSMAPTQILTDTRSHE